MSWCLDSSRASTCRRRSAHSACESCREKAMPMETVQQAVPGLSGTAESLPSSLEVHRNASAGEDSCEPHLELKRGLRLHLPHLDARPSGVCQLSSQPGGVHSQPGQLLL